MRTEQDIKDLIKLYQVKDDHQAFKSIYDNYKSMVFAICFKYFKDQIDAEETLQEVFVKLIKELKKHSPNNFTFWLARVTKNLCIDRLKAKLKLPIIFPKDPPDDVQNEENESLEDMYELIDLGLHHLKLEQQLCVKMFYLEEKTYKQIAEETGYEWGEVRTHIQNGKLNLKKYVLKNNNM